MNNEKKSRRYAGAVLTIALVAGMLVGYNFLPTLVIEQSDADDGEWRVVFQGGPSAAAEYVNDPGESGWLATFCLDYDEVPATVLADNTTDWSSAATARGYTDADNASTDLESEDPFYFVVRCRFNDTVKSGADFIGSRCRCSLTVSGDETISDVTATGDENETGGTLTDGWGVVSQNGSDWIYINFYWDDNSDGYQISDDGELLWDIVIEAKY